MSTDLEPVVLGKVSGLFGVKGWVKIHSYTEPREAILDYPQWLLEIDGKWQARNPAEGKRHGKTVIVRFEGTTDRDAATGFVGALVGVDRSAMPEPAEGAYYWSDLEGLTVEEKSGNVLGTVAYLLDTGANDVLVVRHGDQEILIPFVTGQVVTDVDLVNGVIRVDWEWD